MKLDINREFRKAFHLLENTGETVFITGRAGTGKSTFLNYFVEHTNKEIAVLAPTGVAALNVAGQTIHSFFGFKPGVTIKEAEEAAYKRRDKRLYWEIDGIVIDEISMVRADLLDCVDRFMKIALNSKKPFGGKQMIFIGDLYQLPPVVQSKEKTILRKEYQSPYFFDAKVMQKQEIEFIEFEKIYRQKEENFIKLLNSIRNKSFTEKDIAKINERFLEKIKNDEGYVYLTCLKKAAEEINVKKLAKLPGKERIFKGIIEGKFGKDSLPTEVTLKLKDSAQVMFLANDREQKWVNGTLGTVSNVKAGKHLKVKLFEGNEVLVKPYTWEIFKFYYDSKLKCIAKEIIGRFKQYPLRLAWAVTIHKSQGKTFDKTIIDIGKGTFSHGQMYVALSRCTSLDGIILKKKIRERDVWMDWRIVKFLTNFQYNQAEKKLGKTEKQRMIEKAIKNKQALEITYLRANDEKTKRVIQPLRIGMNEFKGYRYKGVEAYCFNRKAKRNFKIERILELKEFQK